jgi:isopentenyl-diphosphate Delta-isomerase
MTEEQVILVDQQDNPIGLMGKQEAHVTGALHRAFSIFVFNDKDELLIHRRSLSKYHSPGLWTNTCCSHPRANESCEEAAMRRLEEEMGFQCQLTDAFKFTYKAELENGLIEHEVDHVFTGTFNGEPAVNPEEVDGWKYEDVNLLLEDMILNSALYTAWFKLALPIVIEKLSKKSRV